MLGAISVAAVLLILAAVLLVAGLVLLLLSPLLATRLATSRAKLERRASGPDRMRALIHAQRAERKKRSTFSGGLARVGLILAAAAVLSLMGGAVAWLERW